MIWKLTIFLALASYIAAQNRGDVRLVKGSGPSNGYLGVYHDNGRFGYVCDDTSSPGDVTTLGTVACRNLGRSFVKIQTSATTSGSIILDDMACIGNETNLDECGHAKWFTDNCGSKEYVFLTCSDLPCDARKSNCSQICNNSADRTSYTCSCEAGYTLGADGYSCDDVDECLVDNGGCSHQCINTVGSYYCSCPRYLYLSSDNATCTADGFTVDCSSPYGMKIMLDRQQFFFLPNALTLTDTRCTSTSNSTHIWLYTDYTKCGTIKKVAGDDIIYSNAVLDSKTNVGGIRFFDDIKIPFQCRLAAGQTISQGINTVPNQLVMRIDEQGLLDNKFVLLSGDSDASPEMNMYSLKQGDKAHVRLSAYIDGLKSVPVSCDVMSDDRVSSQRLISNGKPASFLTQFLPSNQTRFSYPVFTFNSKGSRLLLECNSSFEVSRSIMNNVTNDSLIFTQEEIRDIDLNDRVDLDVAVPVIVKPSDGVSLMCGPEAMRLTIKGSILGALSTVDDLAPLNKDCFGYHAQSIGDNFVYTVPLDGCGAQVEVVGDKIVFTNSLIYADNVTGIKYFSDIVLTHSCSYPLSNYLPSLNYTVGTNSFNFGAENKEKTTFNVNLDLFSDKDFKNLINNGGYVSVAEGIKMFGNIGVTSSDRNLKVALNQCSISPSATPGDLNSKVIIKDGCKTAYGSTVLSADKFAIQAGSFGGQRGQNIYLHCSVVVCDSSDMSRCTKSCVEHLPGSVIG